MLEADILVYLCICSENTYYCNTNFEVIASLFFLSILQPSLVSSLASKPPSPSNFLVAPKMKLWLAPALMLIPR